MANSRQTLPLSRSTSRSPRLLFTLSLVAFFLLVLLTSLTRNPSPSPNLNLTPSHSDSKPETSFVASLQHFLSSKPKSSPTIRDDTARTPNDENDVRELDNKMLVRETERLYDASSYYPVAFPIRVYVYEMPSKFTYDLLWLFQNTYRETGNITSNGSPVHRLIEQHSIDYWLWADLIAPESERLLKTVVRVYKQEEADLFYIPFFTTISFFLLEKEQYKPLYRVKH